MNKEAFKQRMQSLKSYREQNPGKGYWDFKSYEEGGEVPPKMMKKVIEEVSNIDSMREVARASRQFNNINKYTRWFNAIPLLGLGAAAMYNNNQKE